MKKTLIFILLILTVTMSRAIGQSTGVDAVNGGNPVELAKKGDAAYATHKYGDAIKFYEQALQKMSSATLWYNLGNAQYRAGAPGKAILAYERALRLDPGMSEARANFEFLNSRIVDRPGQRGSFIERKVNNLAERNSSDAWAWAAFGLFILAAAGVAVYMMGSNVLLRKVGFFGAAALLLLCLVTLFLSFKARAIAQDDSLAVVTSRSTILSTVPRQPSQQNEEAMMLHEGTMVEIIDTIDSNTGSAWYHVRIDNNHTAWINAADVTRIAPF